MTEPCCYSCCYCFVLDMTRDASLSNLMEASNMLRKQAPLEVLSLISLCLYGME